MVTRVDKKHTETLQVDGGSINWHRIGRLALTSRMIDLFEEEELVPQKKIFLQFSSKGHELAQVIVGTLLDHPNDGATVYYRSRPFMLACGYSLEEMFAGKLGLIGSPSEGRDTGVLCWQKASGGPTVLPPSGDVGAQYTPAVGWAQAITYYQDEIGDQSWAGAIAVAMGGDGSVASNGFWSALNISTTLNLPILFVIEDNQFGISVPSYLQTPGGDIAENLSSFGNLFVLSGSGTNPPETMNLVQKAISHVRGRNGPCLLRLRVPRLAGHVFGEDPRAYKSDELIEQEKLIDPITHLQNFLREEIDWEHVANEINTEVRASFEKALRHPQPDPEEINKHMFFSSASYDQDQGVENASKLEDLKPDTSGSRINMLEAIHRVMDHELSHNPLVLVFGEDVGPRGGVHRATFGLQDKYGVQRVFDTSLSEEGIIGRSLGMALAGLRPLPEIQFRKYADPAIEQINDIGWIRWRTLGKFTAPVVIRMPLGPRRQASDPYHALFGEAIFTHLLGWQIAFPSNAADAAGLLRTAVRGENPTIFLEHRTLIDHNSARRPYPGDDYMLPFGKAGVIEEGDSMTIITWGEMVHNCVQAAKSYQGKVEILDLRTLIPWDRDAVLSSCLKTGKLMVVHEDSRTGGFAGEIISTVVEEMFTSLDAPIVRLASKDNPIPFNINLRNATIPTVNEIQERIEYLLAW